MIFSMVQLDTPSIQGQDSNPSVCSRDGNHAAIHIGNQVHLLREAISRLRVGGVGIASI